MSLPMPELPPATVFKIAREMCIINTVICEIKVCTSMYLVLIHHVYKHNSQNIFFIHWVDRHFVYI